MNYYTVLAVTPTTEEWVTDYIGPANALVTKHGGRYLVRTSSHKRLEGEGEGATLRIIIEWPSKEAAQAFRATPLTSPTSRHVLPARTAITFSSKARTTSPERPDISV